MAAEEEEEEEKHTARLRLRHPPPSLVETLRESLSLHVLIMINAGSTTHTLKPRFWQGSDPGPAVLCEPLTLPSGS